MNYRLLAFLSFVTFIGMFGFHFIEKFLTFHLLDFMLKEEVALKGSIILMIIYFSFSFSHLFAGKLIEEHGEPKAIGLGILLYAPFCFSLAFSRNYWLFLATALLLGIGASLFWTGIGSFIVKNFEERGEASGFSMSASRTGAFLASIGGGFLLFLFVPVTNLFLLGGLCVVASSVAGFLLKGKGHGRPRPRISWSEQLKFFRDRNLLSLGIVSLISNSFIGVAIPLVPIIVREELPPIIASPAGKGLEVGIVMSGLYLLGIISSFLGGKMSDVKGRKVFYYMVFLVGSFSAFVIYLAESVWIVLLGVLIFSPFLWLTVILNTACVGDLYKEKQSLALVVVGFISYLGFGGGALLSAVGSLQSLKFPFLVLGVLFLVSILLVRKLPIK